MDISLSPEMEMLIQQQLDSGIYANASEVVAQALMMMAEREELLEDMQLKLRQEIQVGLDSGPASAWNLEDFQRQARWSACGLL